jgi:predicted alpha-1,2-mannosidase
MRWLTVAPLCGLWLVLGACSVEKEIDYTGFVDPFIGTGGHGHTYPGATVPFGSVQVSPDTRLTGWDGCSGYHYSDSLLYGFSHTHLSGTGCSDYGDILFMPAIGGPRLPRAGGGNRGSGYASPFSHRDEVATPGYYRVKLGKGNITVELTATKRAGFHRYVFPKSDSATVLVDLEHRDPVIDSRLRFVSDTEIEGSRRSKAWAEDQRVYFVARFSKPFSTRRIAVNDRLRPGAAEASGTNVKGYVSFKTAAHEAILVKVGISAVDVDGARKNLEAEIPGWDFESVRADAREAWNEALGRIRVVGGTRAHMVTFYTALYHAMLAPNLYMDVDGRYRGRDLEIHHADGFTNYTVFSLWDTYRAEHPLLAIIEPGRTADFITTFIAQYEQGGALPVWELAGNETNCMIGYHAVPVIADAYLKGIRDFDAAKALEAMEHSAERDDRGLERYRELGYIPADTEGESVSKTLEYAYDDWCIAQMAKALGKEREYSRYIERAQSYKNIFDPKSGFMRAKMDGAFLSPFDPAEVNVNYTEANAWQYSFSVPQDVGGLIDLMGGREHFAAKLDSLFSMSTKTTGTELPDISGLIGQYAHGNEPSHHIAYLYCYAGKPWKTQERVRKIMDGLYGAGPAGLCGNEDCGQMSAWYVLSALGFYPVTPGSDIYVIGSPVFKEASIDVGGGRRFVIRTRGGSADNVYVQSAALNGKPYGACFIRHADIASGGELLFDMGEAPNMAWGTGSGDAPASAIVDHLILPVPYVASGERIFGRSTEIVLSTIGGDGTVRYTLDGTDPNALSSPYERPLLFTRSATVKARAYKEGFPPSAVMTAEFRKIPGDGTIHLNTRYSPMYTAGGDLALIDGVMGSDDFRTGRWQGYHGVDLDAVVDLGVERRIGSVSTGFLEDQNSWIFWPSMVEYLISSDGVLFTSIAKVSRGTPGHDEGSPGRDEGVPGRDEGARIERVSSGPVGLRARFVRVRATSIGVCPAWHRGAGEKAWIFADEIAVDWR